MRVLKEQTRWGWALIWATLSLSAPHLAFAAAGEMGTLQVYAEVEGVPLFLDGVLVGESPFSAPWFLKPGTHTLEAKPASGAMETRTFEIKVGAITEVSLLKLPEAERKRRAAAMGPRVRTIHTGPGFSLAVTGYGALGLGGVMAGLGIFLGLDAESKAAEARDLDPRRHTRAQQLDLLEQVDNQAFYSNVSFGAAGTLLLGGAALLFFASDGPLGAHTTLMPTGQGLSLGGRF